MVTPTLAAPRMGAAMRHHIVRIACLGLAASGTWLSAQALTFDDALTAAEDRAPILAARRAAIDGATAARKAAGRLPDPELKLGIDNLPVSGPDAGSLYRDAMTMRRVGWMQAMPSQAKRSAQEDSAEAQIQQARAMEALERLKVRRETALAWLQCWFAQRQLELFNSLEAEHHLLASTMSARVASGRALPAEAALARIEGHQLSERRDELQLQRDQAQLQLQRWLGAKEAILVEGEAPAWLHATQAHTTQAPTLGDPEPPTAWAVQLGPIEAATAAAQADLHGARAARHGDWSWEVGYGKRAAQYGDMVSLQVSIELPTSPGTRQDPVITQRYRDIDRLAAEREDAVRRLTAQARMQQAEAAQLQRAWRRQTDDTLPLAQARARLQTASYEAGRGDLGHVLAARHDALEATLRALTLEARLAQAQASLKYLIVE